MIDPRPQNPAEALVWKTMVLTWPFYFVGALYIVGPVLAWIMGALAGLSLYLGPAMRADLRATGTPPPVTRLRSNTMRACTGSAPKSAN